MDESVEVDHDGRGSALDGFEFRYGGCVSDGFTWRASGDRCCVCVVTCEEESVELVCEHAVGAGETVAASEFEC